MRIGHEIHRKILIAAALLVLCAPAWSQDTGNSTGQEGGRFARELIDRAQAPVLNETGGRNDAGTVVIGDQELQIGELLPGATRSSMDQVKSSTRTDDVRELERQGTAEYNRVAREEGSAGEAARAVFDASGNSAGAAHPDVQWLVEQGLVSDPLAESFADCEATAEFIPGDTIQSTIYSSESCTVGLGPDAGGAAICGREHRFRVEWLEVYNPDLPLCPPLLNDTPDIGDGRWQGSCNRYKVVRETMGTGQCEDAAAAAGCQMEWECTAEGDFEIEHGIFGNEDLFDRLGIPALFPGAPKTCRAARSRLTCPVCIENDDGSQHSCSMVDVTGSEGSTCSALDQDASCRQVGTTCVLRDEQTGQCALTSRRYSCERPRQINSTVVMMGNTCNAQVQCADGSCSDLEGLDGPPGMNMQEAMARMAVTETMLTDRSTPDEIPPGDGSGQPTAEQQRMMEQIQLFKGEQWTCQRGYAGLVDCCGRTQTDAHELYWSIYQRVTRDRQASQLSEEDGQSAYELWQEGGAGYDSLSNPFTSLRENVMGGSDRPVEAVTMTIWEEFIARAREEIRPSLSPSWMCSDSEFDLAIQREVDMCSYAGTYCSQRVLGACLKRRESYCCYNSPMSKALRASAEPGGELQHGDAKNADCSGLQIEELDRINWDAIDFTRLAGNMAEGGAFDRANDPANAEANYTGSGQSGAMAQGRQSLGDRSMERLDSFDGDSTRQSIGQDVASRDYRAKTQAQSGPARLSFTSGTTRGQAGRPIIVSVGRQGSSGPASAQVTVVGGSPETAGFWQETLYWGAGDTTSRSVTLMPPLGASGQVLLELTALEGSVAGHAQILVDVE